MYLKIDKEATVRNRMPVKNGVKKRRDRTYALSYRLRLKRK